MELSLTSKSTHDRRYRYERSFLGVRRPDQAHAVELQFGFLGLFLTGNSLFTVIFS